LPNRRPGNPGESGESRRLGFLERADGIEKLAAEFIIKDDLR
jgi:hypothetical protein